jgi:uncharacterized Zn finger protein
MAVQLNEKVIRDRASDQSFQKGLAYYRSGAVYNPTLQSTPGGVSLTAQCEGSNAPSYRLRVELDEGGVRSASCTCPIEIYRHIKQLAGENWLNLRPTLIQKASNNQAVLVDIQLEEEDWDAAIKVAELYIWSFNLLEKVADAVIFHRPDWVIRMSLKQSNELILKTQSNLYPVAARWLERAKKAYWQKGQDAEWQAYIDHLRATYARRPAVQREIKDL